MNAFPNLTRQRRVSRIEHKIHQYLLIPNPTPPKEILSMLQDRSSEVRRTGLLKEGVSIDSALFDFVLSKNKKDQASITNYGLTRIAIQRFTGPFSPTQIESILQVDDSSVRSALFRHSSLSFDQLPESLMDHLFQSPRSYSLYPFRISTTDYEGVLSLAIKHGVSNSFLDRLLRFLSEENEFQEKPFHINSHQTCVRFFALPQFALTCEQFLSVSRLWKSSAFTDLFAPLKHLLNTPSLEQQQQIFEALNVRNHYTNEVNAFCALWHTQRLEQERATLLSSCPNPSLHADARTHRTHAL
jgi:hypothetical protein